MVIAAAIWMMIVTCYAVVTIVKNQKRKHMNMMMLHFSEWASKFNMRFSSQEVLKNAVIGLDGVQRKILVLRKTAQQYNAIVIDLAGVTSCTVRKQYGTINGGALPGIGLENFLVQIVLHFEFADGRAAEEIPFYDKDMDSSKRTGMGQKARLWETLLSQLIRVPVKAEGKGIETGKLIN